MKMNKFCKEVIVVLLSVCCVLVLVSCAQVDDNEYIAGEFDGFFVKPSGYVLLEKSIAECIEEADIIVKGTISETGTAFVSSGQNLSARMSELELKDAVMKIQTPMELSVQNLYKNEVLTTSSAAVQAISNEGVISFNENYGVVDNAYKLYPLENQLEIKENKTYILFIKVVNGTYHVMHQPSVVINEDGSFESLLMNTELYVGCNDYADAVEMIEQILSE